MKSNQLLIALAFTSAASAFAAPALQTYTYTVRVPASGTTCEGAAQNLATIFQAAAPSATNVQGHCVTRTSFTEDGAQHTVDNLKVTYSADYPLFMTTAQIPNNSYQASHVYKKYSDCVSDLGQQSALYAQATGLNPIAASCVPGVDASYGYTLKIDALGTPARQLKTLNNLANDLIQRNPEWKQQVLGLITQSGGIIAKISDESIEYYAASGVEIDTRSWFHTETKEQCEAQAGEMATILQKLGAQHMITACHADGPENAGLIIHYYMDTAFDTSALTAFVTTYNQNFFSYDECMAVRSSNVFTGGFGSFCSVSDFGDGRYTLSAVTRF
jgi:hypothetical protein